MSETPGHYAEGPEALVVSLAIKGDRVAFAELVRRRQSWIRNLMRRLSGDGNLADDLSQQVLLKAWRKIRQLKEAEKFGGWLKRLAVNEWLQFARRKDPLKIADLEAEITASHRDRATVAMDLDRALASLEAPVRTCVVLSYHERLSHREISELTGMQLGTVKSHIRRGSQRLRELLSAYGETTAAAEDGI